MKPLISAFIEVFDHERYIERALISVAEQGLSLSELEIAVVDDGSTENDPEITPESLPRVKYLEKKNGSQASAFNGSISGREWLHCANP